MERGMVHLYWGTGKGKTTAAMGLALRALGKGMGVTVVQFLKGGMSGELSPLERLGARIYSGAAGDRFFFQMSEAERKELAQAQTRLLHQALQVPCDLLILDDLGSELTTQFTQSALYELCLLYTSQSPRDS